MILVRGHHHFANDVQAGARRDFALNVTGYRDISELFLISDVLITDYSSVMFDFAATGRPMLFFTYDLEHYRDQLRGFYFDFEAEAPGPAAGQLGRGAGGGQGRRRDSRPVWRRVSGVRREVLPTG